MVDARGLHGLALCTNGPRHTRHSQLNDLIWRAVKKAQIPASKEPIELSRADGKRPDGATLVPWTRGKPLAWDVIVPDTYAASQLQLTSTTPCAAAENAAVNKTTKYVALAAMHSFIPVAIEASGAWCLQSAEFMKDLGRRITTIINEPLETTEDVSNTTERQCSRLLQYIARALIFTYGRPS